MVDERFREWVRSELGQDGRGLSSYVSNARQLETRFGIAAMTLPQLRALKAEIAAAPERAGRDFVLYHGGERHNLNPNVRMMLDAYIRYRQETGVRPARKPAATRNPAKPAEAHERDFRRLTSRKAVLAAMAELEHMDDDQVRLTYRFAPAKSYVVRHGRYALASKAVVGVAFRYQHPEVGPLTPKDLSGGRTEAGRHLTRLGFDVDGMSRQPDDWTLEEVEYIVATYFAMWQAQAARTYRRRDHLKAADTKLGPRRSRGSIGRKLSNISAILQDLGLPVLQGFPALGNKQTLLTAVVTDWLTDHPDVFDAPSTAAPPMHDPDFGAETPPPSGLALRRVRRERRGVKVDFANRDARNRALGRSGEEWALAKLKETLLRAGRPDLARRTRWESDVIGDGIGYDIVTYDPDGSERYVEVKTTNQGETAPFILTANELAASEELGDAYVLMRVYAFNTDRRFYRLTGDLSAACDLRPTTYAASPR